MKFPLATLALLAISSCAVAADSRCLLGDDGKIAVTTLEHRAGAGTRSTDVTLIFGSHLLRGQLKNTDSGAITLRETCPNGKLKYNFVGYISVNYQTYQIKIKGTLHFTPKESATIHTMLPGKVLEPAG